MLLFPVFLSLRISSVFNLCVSRRGGSVVAVCVMHHYFSAITSCIPSLLHISWSLVSCLYWYFYVRVFIMLEKFLAIFLSVYFLYILYQYSFTYLKVNVFLVYMHSWSFHLYFYRAVFTFLSHTDSYEVYYVFNGIESLFFIWFNIILFLRNLIWYILPSISLSTFMLFLLFYWMYTLHECIYTHCSRFLSMSYFIQVYGTITVVHLFQYKWIKLCLIPNKFQLPQLLWEVSDLMGPSLIHKEMLIVRILSKSCEDKDGYSELMSVMTIISITHCFLVCLPIQGFCSLFEIFLVPWVRC